MNDSCSFCLIFYLFGKLKIIFYAKQIFFTHAFFLLYGLAMHAYAIDDISLPDRIRQEQRLKELNR